MSREFWVIGPGRVGLSLAAVLARAGHPLTLVGRRPALPSRRDSALEGVRYLGSLPGPPPPGGCTILAVPDGSIAGVASQLADAGTPGAGCVALHLSGALDASALAPLARRGYATASLHPLQTVADPLTGPERLRRSFFTFEGSPKARPAAQAIVAAAEGTWLELPAGEKARYHAACVFASNYLVTCAAVATRLLAAAAGIDEERASHALAPLWRGSIENLEQLGVQGALTGPVARGDAGTVRANLAALDDADRELYRQLALRALEIGRRAGLPVERADAVEAVLRESRGLDRGRE